jgi:hypothetical protein
MSNVSGLIADVAGRPIFGIKVRAVDRDMRSEQVLGEAVTDAKGYYSITYDVTKYSKVEIATADLIVRVLDVYGKTIVESDTVFQAADSEVIDLVVPRSRTYSKSEYEDYTNQLAPAIDSIPVAQLTDADLGFLTRETGIPIGHLRFLRLDAQYASNYQIDAAGCYGLFRQGLPTAIHQLAAIPPARLTELLKKSIDERIVPSALSNRVTAIVDRLASLAGSTGPVIDGLSRPPLEQVVATAGLTTTQQQTFTRYALEHGADTDFWAKLASQPGFDAASASNARFTVEANPLVCEFIPALSLVQNKKQSEGWTSVRDLARLTPDQWLALAQQACPNGPPAGFASVDQYGATIARAVEYAFPSAVIQHQLVADPQLGGADISAFFQQHPTFDLLYARIEEAGPARTRLLEVQRVGRLVPRDQPTAAPKGGIYGGVQALLARGYASAQAVAHAGKAKFVQELGPVIGDTAAEVMFQQAKLRADAANLVRMRLRDTYVDHVNLMPHGDPDSAADPEVAALLGATSACACEHCRSVLGPAAYLTDLLHFLDTAPPAHTPTTPPATVNLAAVLRARRPELEHILLDCDNANTPLPYIDLVNEILEDAMAGDVQVRQTTWTADELRVAPEHLREEAYAPLAAAVHPWALPFDLAHERVRLYAEHLGLELDLLRDLFGRTQDAVTQAYFGMSDALWRTVTTAPSGSERWGGVALDTLVAVPAFLDASGLSYAELAQLTETWFLSASGLAEIAIDRGGDPCDPGDDTLSGLAGIAADERARRLDQIQRFVRLARHQGWSLDQDGELDAALRALDASAIDATTLAGLARLHRLARAWRLTLREIADALASPELAAERVRGWLGITDLELARFLELNGFSAIGDLATLETVLERWPSVRDAGVDVRALSYVLTGWDQSPPAFTATDAETLAHIHDLQRAVRAAVAQDLDTPAGEAAAQAIVESLAGALELDADAVARLIRPVTDEDGNVVAAALVKAHGDPAEPAITDLLAIAPADPATPAPADTDPIYGHVASLLAHLRRAARLVRDLGLARRELDAIAATTAANGFLDLDTLRTVGAAGATDRLDGWRQLAQATQLRRTLPRGDADVFDAIAQAMAGALGLDDPDAAATLGAVLGVTGDTAVALADALALRGVDAAARPLLAHVESYQALHEAAQALTRWRITPAVLAQWSDPATSVADLAASLASAIDARYPETARRNSVLTPIHDTLREKRRDALLAYLVETRAEFAGADDVYAHYLIDVEMSSCALTSRIKQAVAAVQLFVQRLQMNVDRDARLDAGSATHFEAWEWMKHYRVWEANRKVFLYPENWLEPDLRDDKSPFFRELENALLQDDVTDDLIESAYRGYLEQFDQVGRLDIRGLYHDEETDTLHVVGRTHSEPHLYYYRRRTEDRVWSAWQKIDVPIEGDSVAPVVHFGRLLLFWTTVEKLQEHDHQIAIHWSEYREGKWQTRRTQRVGQPAFAVGPTFDPVVLLRTQRIADVLEVDVFFAELSVAPYRIARFVFDDYRQTLVLDRTVTEIAVLLPPTDAAIRDGKVVSRTSYVLDAEQHPSAYAPTTGTTELALVERVDAADSFAYPDLPAILFDDDISRAEWSAHYLNALALGIRTYNGLRASARDVPIFGAAPADYRITFAQQTRQTSLEHPFVFEAGSRIYLATPHRTHVSTDLFRGGGAVRQGTTKKDWLLDWDLRFENLYHPYVETIVREVNRHGVDGLLAPAWSAPGTSLDRQLLAEPEGVETIFGAYGPVSLAVAADRPIEELDFSLTGAYSIYNWELFFHIPLLVADRLSKNQRFEEARRWFHYIFDPTDVSSHPFPAKHWRVKPLYEQAMSPVPTIDELMRRLAEGSDELEEQITAWRRDAFNPHLIARHRVSAYMRTVVMKYLDNLIAWGDHLFEQDTIEALNEATQLYVLAAEILGPRPVTLPAVEQEARDYASLRDDLDAFSNALVELEAVLPADLPAPAGGTGGEPLAPHLAVYFCIPANDKLDAYRDTIADRLFKLRNCRNLAGQRRQLPLYEPPIDPALLVRARAAGLDIGEALDALAVSRPRYRFAIVQQKAQELAGAVASLGAELLSALEKRDAEELALLRSRHELALLPQVTLIKQQQVEEAEQALEGVRASHRSVERRRDRLAQWAAEYRSPAEEAHLGHLHTARGFEMASQGFAIASAFAHAFPEIHGGPSPAVVFGGTHIGNALQGQGSVLGLLASQYTFEANMSSINASHQRRRDEWQLQVQTATLELEQLDRQIAAAEIRVAVARQELANHQQQLEHAREVDDFMRAKFTSRELFGWMVGQLSALHYQTYKLARDLARRAEVAAQHELGVAAEEFTYIGLDHWDSLRKGLLAGQKLQHELRRMEVAYLDRNERLHELTKHVSLAALDPAQLVQLRTQRSCTFTVPELLFDLDFPGHFRRRLKSVSVTIPCVTGPYTNVSAKLTLEQSWIRQSSDVSGGYAFALSAGDDRILIDPIPTHSIATSTAQRDSGMFELSFRDDRYLPFEGAGAISRWRLELPGPVAQFDHDTISDVILHLSYTAKEDPGLVDPVTTFVQGALERWLVEQSGAGRGIPRLLDFRQELSSELYRFLHPAEGESYHDLAFTLLPRHFPPVLRVLVEQGRITLRDANLVFVPKRAADRGLLASHAVQLGRTATSLDSKTLAVDAGEPPLWGGLPAATFDVTSFPGSPAGAWLARLDPTGLDATLTETVDGRIRLRADVLDDVLLLLVLGVAP